MKSEDDSAEGCSRATREQNTLFADIIYHLLSELIRWVCASHGPQKSPDVRGSSFAWGKGFLSTATGFRLYKFAILGS